MACFHFDMAVDVEVNRLEGLFLAIPKILVIFQADDPTCQQDSKRHSADTTAAFQPRNLTRDERTAYLVESGHYDINMILKSYYNIFL